jgi:hypothetical protein
LHEGRLVPIDDAGRDEGSSAFQLLFSTLNQLLSALGILRADQAAYLIHVQVKDVLRCVKPTTFYKARAECQEGVAKEPITIGVD